uniref:Uncharacterized protein n=1 Tax=Inoviridae sp. ctjYd14 TaxID=2825784 RepID=A0A8S5RUD1_9VIRU|nr:MAG TPA: hypothetical protein [Inoviridae sp. ctjYd14]
MNNEIFKFKTNNWLIQSVNVNFDRNWNVASMYLLLANPKLHQYTKKVYLTVEDFVDIFGQPWEFSKEGISAITVGNWVEITESMELLDEEPVQAR